MDGSSTEKATSQKMREDRLESWKEIAAYLNRDVTTVQRWEKREGMPVHRHLHDRMGSVYAYRADLDAWARSRKISNTEESSGAATLPPDHATSRPGSRGGRVAGLVAAALIAVAIGGIFWLRAKDYFWRNPIANARFETLTDFDGVARDAALSRDGQFVAFLSDRDGPMDVWVTQVGSGQFHNLTHGSAPELVNPSVRTLGFTPDGSWVTFWVRRQNGSSGGDISIWSVPTLGGQPRPYLEGVAEFDWTRDGSQLAYHTPGPGDPLFVTRDLHPSASAAIFRAAAGLHSHFPLWAPDGSFIYFVQGSLPDKMDLWRIRPTGGEPERITSHNSRVSYPVFLDSRTLVYLASDADGSGPWLYALDVERRIPHRLGSGLERYTSVAASTDGRRVAVTGAAPKTTLWRLRLGESPAQSSAATRVSLSTGVGFAPRLGPDYVAYISANGANESIWKLAQSGATELWRGEGAKIVGAPAISFDGHSIAFSARQHGKTSLYLMQADGTNVRLVSDSLNLQGAPAWAPDGKSIISAAEEGGVTHLFRVPLDGGPPTSLVKEYSTDPAWAPDGQLLVYSGADVGTKFSLKAVAQDGSAQTLPELTLTRGARHLAFLPGGRSLILLRGEIQHKNLWLVDLQSGKERQLTDLSPDFDIRDFDVSRDGKEVVLERVQERSDVVLLDLGKP